MKAKANILIALALCFVFVCMGCGRKLPPLPPGQPDPFEIISIRFVEETVIAKARCNASGAQIVLLGKAKGICPACTDDLEKKDEAFVDDPGVVVLKDTDPAARYMVYRIAFQKDSTAWLTQAQVVRK